MHTFHVIFGGPHKMFLRAAIGPHFEHLRAMAWRLFTINLRYSAASRWHVQEIHTKTEFKYLSADEHTEMSRRSSLQNSKHKDIIPAISSCCALCTHTPLVLYVSWTLYNPLPGALQVNIAQLTGCQDTHKHTSNRPSCQTSTASLNCSLCSAYWKHPNEIGDEWNNSHKHAAVFNIPLRDARQRKLCTDYCFVREMHSGLQWGGRLY